MAPDTPRAPRGIDEFIAYLSQRAAEVFSGRVHETQFIRRVGEDCANIRLGDVGRPVTFLRQLAQVPLLPFPATGFKPGLVDDALPARHYTAFLVVGFWLPVPLALVILFLWELAGYVRYGVWSRRDVASGRIGIRHGRLVRRDGPTILPGLVAGELACRPSARSVCD